MEYEVLGKTGVEVSKLAFGTMTFTSGADKEAAKAMFDRCREAGINFFDTANVYGEGREGRVEKILGEFISDCRDEVVIAAKVGTPKHGGINDGGLSRRYIMHECEASLKRLNTDRIDFYFLHKCDPNTPMEQTLRALNDLQKQGKILYPAVSNHAAWQISRALGISAKEKLARFECIQPMYNLVKRQAEVEIFPLAQEENLGVVSYSPLGAGLLTGKYSTKDKPEEGRVLESERYKKRYEENRNFHIAEKFTEHSRESGVKPATLAVAWAMSHPAVTAPIIGARNVDQLEDSLAALEVNMTPEWREKISNISYTPPDPLDRTEDMDRPGH